MIGSICSEPKIMEVMRIVNTIIIIIKIIVPIALILVAMIKLMKIVSSGSDEDINGAKKGLINSSIAAVSIFLVPTVVSLLVGLVFPNKDYKDCLVVKSREEINAIYEQRAEALISHAEETFDMNDYSQAKIYLSNIKNKEKKKEYQERLEVIRNYHESLIEVEDFSNVTDYGKNVPVSDPIKKACDYLLNQDTYQVRLKFCINQYGYVLTNPQGDLPGGASYYDGTWHANATIPFSQYRMGMFFGEIGPAAAPYANFGSFLQIFDVMYTNVFLFNNLSKLGNPIIDYDTGECSQLYLQTRYNEYYASGAYKDRIDSVANSTKYFILVNQSGELINVRYNTTSGILGIMVKAASEGKDMQGILDAMKSGHKFADNYKGGVVYDCRNLK